MIQQILTLIFIINLILTIFTFTGEQFTRRLQLLSETWYRVFIKKAQSTKVLQVFIYV